MNTPRPATDDTLTVLYDGGCPLCRREIAHVQGLAERQGGAALCFVDISQTADPALQAEQQRLLARFHVQKADGSRLQGAAAFAAMWDRLPGWRWLARMSRWPGMLWLLERAYDGFLKVRPALQSLARRLEPVNDTATTKTDPTAGSGWSEHLVRELRSDHAGETGAVEIYRGIAAVARRRGDAELLAFAERHGATESEHLRLIEAWLPPAQRSRLLGPWRLAGWLTGALPALAGPRAVYGTIAAVETFVDHHYQQQIDHIRQHGGPPGLLELLLQCQADKCHHRDEAASLAGQTPWPLKLWCRVVGSGSAAAVVLARRV